MVNRENLTKANAIHNLHSSLLECWIFNIQRQSVNTACCGLMEVMLAVVYFISQKCPKSFTLRWLSAVIAKYASDKSSDMWPWTMTSLWICVSEDFAWGNYKKSTTIHMMALLNINFMIPYATFCFLFFFYSQREMFEITTLLFI